MKCIPAITLVLATTAAFAPAAFARHSPAQAAVQDQRIAHILAERAKVKDIPAVALSPDGKHVAWLVSHAGETTLALAEGDGSHARELALPGECNPEELRWSPRGDQLAVLTRCKVDPSNTQTLRGAIWMVDAASGMAAKKIADLSGFAQGMQWTRDAREIVLLYVPGATRLPAATASANPRVGVIGRTNVQVQRVATISIATGAAEILTPQGLYVYEFALSPDDGRLAYTAATPPGDDNWWTAKLYVQAAKPGAATGIIVDPATVAGSLHGLQMALPRWSPDGTRILFIGGLMSDRGSTGGDIYSVSSAGGTPQDLTAGVQVTPAWFAFTDAHTLLVSQIAGGSVELADYALAGDAAKQTRAWFTAAGGIGDGGASLAVSLADTHPRRIAYAADSFDHPPEVHAGVLDDTPPPAVTSVNAGLARDWGRAESVTWEHDGRRVQGWLMYPVRYDAHKTYPMIVYVHGGPSWATLPGWAARPTALSEFGYFVLMPNPRGSFGEGEAYTQAIRNQMGYGDLDDILAGVAAVENKVPVDDARLGMMGWSYGGFMTMFAPTRTQRFKAVVTGAGISDWQSYYGQNQIDQWMIPFFGASLYDAPAAYAKSSAIDFIKQTRTPALIVVGERDEECPAAQSFEYWHALKTLGVPTTLVVYANEGHHIAQTKNQEDILRRALDWFGKYLAPRQ